VSSSYVHEPKIERKSERERERERERENGRWRERERGRERDWWRAGSRALVADSGLGHQRSGPWRGQEQWHDILCPPEKAEREERESEVKGRAELGGGEAQGGGAHHGTCPVPSKRRREVRKSRGREAACRWQGEGEEERELGRGVTRA
jgi:hypothetical protein